MSSLNTATLRWLNDLTAQGILTTDTELRIQGWNRWLEQHSGRSAASVLGQPLLEVYPDLVARRLDQSYHQALTGRVVVLAQRLHRYLLPMPPSALESAFRQMQQNARIAPLTADGQIIGSITVIEDVTEREDRERELQRRIATLEGLYEISRAILSLDLAKCLQQIVETMVKLVPAPLVAIVLRHENRLRLEACSYDLGEIDEERLNMLSSVAVPVVRSGQPLHIADTSADKSYLPLGSSSGSVMAAPLIAGSTVIGALIIEAPTPHALTENDQMQLRILAAQAAIGIHNAQLYQNAQDAILTRDGFLSIASHELRTPLTSLLGQTQLLQRRVDREGSLNERDRRSLQIIGNQAGRLNRMMMSLLDLSRIQSGQLSVQRAPLDMGTLVQQAIDEMGPLLDERPVELKLPDEILLVDGDELRLEQVLQNLLQNAVKYSEAGTPIRVEALKHDAMICIHIRDQGIGIAEHEIPRLFERFYRAESVQAQHISGFGVGLYIVKEIVELHHGTIEVVSEQGKGSTFTVCLPMYLQAEPALHDTP